MTPSKSGGRRALDATLNLVPFIDLLSCCIAFLLITAVWSQLAEVNVHSLSHDGDSSAAAAKPFVLIVGSDGLTLITPSGESESLPVVELGASLRRHAVGDELVVRAGEHVSYDLFVRALDAARGAGVTQLDVDFDAT